MQLDLDPLLNGPLVTGGQASVEAWNLDDVQLGLARLARLSKRLARLFKEQNSWLSSAC